MRDNWSLPDLTMAELKRRLRGGRRGQRPVVAIPHGGEKRKAKYWQQKGTQGLEQFAKRQESQQITETKVISWNVGKRGQE